jgi:hypothetical protein
MKQRGTGKVHSLITMGTPHLGSVKVYYAFLMGYTFGNPYARDDFSYYEQQMKTIVQNCPSAYQLLPWEPFIYDESGYWTLEDSYAVRYHSIPGSDAGPYDIELNAIMRIEAEKFRNYLETTAPPNIETYTIIGQGIPTLSNFWAHATERMPPLWRNHPWKGIKKADGSRYWLKPIISRAKIASLRASCPRAIAGFSDGDETVTLLSAEGLQNDKKFYIQHKKPAGLLPSTQAEKSAVSAKHGDLPLNKKVQSLIKDILMGEEVKVEDYKPLPFNNLEGFGFVIHSSANLHIYDSMGNHMGLNEYGSIDEDIPGGTMIEIDGNEYCYIFNPDDSYDVEVIGFEEGNFTLDMIIGSEERTVEFSYPEINVVNGSLASFSIPDTQSAMDDPPEMVVQSGETLQTFVPEVIEDSSVEPTPEPTSSPTPEPTPEPTPKPQGGIPGFPIESLVIGIALVIIIFWLHQRQVR